MHRRRLLALAGGGSLPLSAAAQVPRLARIGVLPSGAEADARTRSDLAALRAGLAALGWQEGRNLELIRRHADGELGRARSAAMELASLAPALIVAIGGIGLTALHRVTRSIPIVFVNVTDPVAGGFVASLTRPGGNVTGFTSFAPDIGGTWLRLLKEMAPGLLRVGLLGDPENHSFNGFQTAFDKAAATLGVTAVSLPVRDAGDIERGLRGMAQQPGGGLVVTEASFAVVQVERIGRLAQQFRLPAIWWNQAQVAAGGLMGFGPDPAEGIRGGAGYVDRILRGATPGDLPVQGPTRMLLSINAGTAKTLGLAIPPTLRAQADEIIE